MTEPMGDTAREVRPATLSVAGGSADGKSAAGPAAPRTDLPSIHAETSPESRPPDRTRGFSSLLSGEAARQADSEAQRDRTFVSDLYLDQIVEAIAGDREDRDLLTALLYQQVHDTGTVYYRHEVFRDLEDPALFETASRFAGQMRQVRAHLGQLAKMHSGHQREGWFLDAAAIYCDALRSLAGDLSSRPITSRGLLAFRDYLAAYLASAEFTQLAADTANRKDDLAKVMYQVRIKGPRVEVSRYDGEEDYSAEIARAFERFQQGAVKDYRIKYRTWPGMNHVGAQILDLVARLFSDEFSALGEYCRRHAGFPDPAVGQFDRELQFYLAYLAYIRPLRSAGLSFCYPELTASSKEIFARDTFDLALAAKLAASGTAVVTNEFHLRGPERIIVVSGPNQGGKTTFARTFGQLHHLASTGCPVPGSAARLYTYDQIFTHFEREEDIANLTGKLEDDLIRIQQALQSATSNSIVIMNEIFTSTTVSDARFLGQKVMEKVIELDLLCVYVTFVDELASLGNTVVSMASTIVPENPAERTYKVVRKPADGLAYALAIADKHRVTYEQLKGRLTS
ncbi:MAG: MutS-related protein [Streptosporangiaceae bacterium]